MLGEAIKMGDDYCPHCNYKVDRASSVDGNYKPEPKDISICINCNTILTYGDDMKLEILPKIVFDTFDKEQKLNILSGVRAANKMKLSKIEPLWTIGLN